MNKFEKYAKSIGFEEKNSIFIREINSFIIYLKEWQYLIMNIPSFYIPLNKSLNKELLKKMEQAALNNACASMTFIEKDDVLIVTIPDGKKDDEKFISTCENVLIRVCKLLAIENYGPMKKCPLCLNEGTYMRFGDNYIPMHEECLNEYVTKLEQKLIDEKKFSSKHILSVGLSLLLAIIGLIPSLLCCIFLNDYFTPLLVLIPLGSIAGLIISKASRQKWLKIITGFIPLCIIVGFSIYSLPHMAEMKPNGPDPGAGL